MTSAFGGPGSAPERPDPAVSRRFSRQRIRDTAPELALRRVLHARGLRYRVHAQPLPGLRRRADIVFPRQRVAVFVDGCFWHRCPEHATSPRTNGEWWQRKLDANTARDRHTDATLDEAGWVVVRIWEHEDPTPAADRVEATVRSRAAKPRRPGPCPGYATASPDSARM